MDAIASFHLIRERRFFEPVVMARLGMDRLRLSGVPGLMFWRLLGTGSGDDTAPSMDARRMALFAIWQRPDDLDHFLARSALARRWRRAEEYFEVRLRGLGGHGTWNGFDVPGVLTVGDPTGPVAVITRARVERSAVSAFAAAGRPVSDEVRNASGLLAVVGIGETPRRRLGTFSMWRDLDAMQTFVDLPHHREVMRRTRDESWYGEEMFARFEPFAASGSWGGHNPLP